MPHARLIVCGRVQGVGFRYFALRAAQAHDVGGWARNLPNGDVEIDADGSRLALDAFTESIRRGPAFARVDRVDTTPLPELGEQRAFTIRG